MEGSHSPSTLRFNGSKDFLATVLHLSGVGTSLSNIAFSGLDSSSTLSKPVTCCIIGMSFNLRRKRELP